MDSLCKWRRGAMNMKKKTIILNITKSDLYKGIPGDMFYCPVARSMHRHEELRSAKVFTHTYKTDTIRFSSFPEEIIIFIKSFDRGRKDKLKPTKFKLEIWI
jgi:hypothetical protein